MKHRVIQWATGAMGKTCLRAVIDHPDLELVGLYVYSDKKAGLDAGEIARRPLTGVKATKSIDEISALDADIVLHCPLLQFPYDAHDADVRRLLESGKNVISINNYFRPTTLPLETANALAESCRKGNATLYGTGINPGFMAERIAPVLSGLCTDVEGITINEIYDCFEMRNLNYVRDVMGMGLPPEKIDLKNGPFAKLFYGMYSQCVAGLAERLGLKLDSIEPDHALVLAPKDIAAPSGTIPQETVAATRWQFHGLRGGERVITHAVNWIMGRDVPGFADFHHWEVTVRGKPGIELKMDLIEPTDTSVRTTAAQYGVAGAVVNTIPHVVDAQPGFFQLPLPPVFHARKDR